MADNLLRAGPVRVGIAGLGFGSAIHLPVFDAMAGVEVTAILGRNTAKVNVAAARCRTAVACMTPEAFLDQPLDAIVIALPPPPSGQLAAAALERGIAVMAEKPIASSAGDARTLADLSADHITVVDFEFRELESFRSLRGLLHSGTLGRVQEVRISWRGMSYAQAHRIWSWKSDADAGGGVITLNGLHVFNLLEWLFGKVSVTSVQLSDEATNMFTPTGRKPAPDTADLNFVTADANTAIHAHLCNAAADRHGHRWEISTDVGLFVLSDGGNGTFGGFTLTQYLAGETRVIATDPDIDGDYRILPVRALAERFVEAVLNNRPVAPAFDEGARAQEILEQVYATA